MNRLLLITALVSALLQAGTALANPFRTISSNGTYTVFRMSGLPPGTEIPVGVGELNRRFQAYLPGYIRFTIPSGATQFREVNAPSWINLSSAVDLTDSVRVSIIAGTRQFVPRTSGGTLPTIPSLLKVGNYIYWNPGSIPSDGILVEFDVPIQRIARVNQCGMVSISLREDSGISTVTVQGTDYTVANLPLGNSATLPRCIRFGESTFIKYLPQP